MEWPLGVRKTKQADPDAAEAEVKACPTFQHQQKLESWHNATSKELELFTRLGLLLKIRTNRTASEAPH